MADRRRRVRAKRTWPRRCRGTRPSAARAAVNARSNAIGARPAPQPMVPRSALGCRLSAYCGCAARWRWACQRPVVAVEVRRHVREPPRHLQSHVAVVGCTLHAARCTVLFVCSYVCMFVRLFCMFGCFVCLVVCMLHPVPHLRRKIAVLRRRCCCHAPATDALPGFHRDM
jgi:hypothetical protein